MGNTAKPARDHFRGVYFDAEDSRRSFEVSETSSRSLDDENSGNDEKMSRESSSQGLNMSPQESSKLNRVGYEENNILPSDIFAKGSQFTESTHRRSKKSPMEESHQCSFLATREHLKILMFVQTTLSAMQPQVDFVDEASDAFMLRLKCLEGTKEISKHKGVGRGASMRSKKQGNDAAERDDDSRFDEEEFLRQLVVKNPEKEPSSPLNLSYFEVRDEVTRGFLGEEFNAPTDRSQLFARYVYDEGDLEDPDDLLSPIKPQKASKTSLQPLQDNCDRGSLEVFVKPKRERMSILSEEEYTERQPTAVFKEASSNQFRHKYFNTNPYDKLFKDLTNTPTTIEKRLAEDADVSKVKADVSAFNRSPSGLPPRGKENTKHTSKTKAVLSKKTDKHCDHKIMTVDLRSDPKRQSSPRNSNQTKLKVQPHGYSGMYSRGSKCSQQSKKEVKIPQQKNKKNNEVREIAPFDECDQALEGEDLWMQIQAELSNQEKPDSQSKKTPASHKARGSAAIDKFKQNLSPKAPVSAESAGQISQQVMRRPTMNNDDYSPEYISPFDCDYRPPTTPTMSNHDGKPAKPVNKPKARQSETWNFGHTMQTESRSEMAAMMQGFQLDSGRKQADHRSMQSEQAAFKLSVNIHKLSQQAMADIGDLD